MHLVQFQITEGEGPEGTQKSIESCNAALEALYQTHSVSSTHTQAVVHKLWGFLSALTPATREAVLIGLLLRSLRREQGRPSSRPPVPLEEKT